MGEALFFGIAGATFTALDFPLAPVLLGYVLGPMVETNFRRALLLSHGDLLVFVQHPISAVFVGVTGLLIILQTYFGIRGQRVTARLVEGSGHNLARDEQTSAGAVFD